MKTLYQKLYEDRFRPPCIELPKICTACEKAPFRDSVGDICDVQFLALNPSNDPSAVSWIRMISGLVDWIASPSVQTNTKN